jgi:hypothetical protein
LYPADFIGGKRPHWHRADTLNSHLRKDCRRSGWDPSLVGTALVVRRAVQELSPQLALVCLIVFSLVLDAAEVSYRFELVKPPKC